MAARVVITCDHCGKEIPNDQGALEVRFSKDKIASGGKIIAWSANAEFNFHEGCAQRAIEAWDDFNAGRLEARVG